MSESEMYLRELRRALPLGCRRRLVAEVREHFASAVAAEAERGVGIADAERLTIARLGPAEALAKQVLADLRSGALGRAGRVRVGLTATRVLAGVTVATIAVAGGAIFAGTHSSRAPSKRRRTVQLAAAHPTVTLDPKTGEVRMVVYALQDALRAHQRSITLTIAPDAVPATPATLTPEILRPARQRR
jgi:HAAS domain-containing protein